MLKKWLFKLLGVDVVIRAAFKEGFEMGRELDPFKVDRGYQRELYQIWGCWKSEREAWANSDVEEILSSDA